MGSVIRSLVVKVGADISDFQKQMTAAGKNMEKTGKEWKKVGDSLSKSVTLPILAAGTAMVALAVKAGQYAEQISIASQTTGMSVKKLQELKYVASQVDVEFETLVGSFAKFTKTLVAARNPAGEQAKLFAQLGVNLKNVDGTLRPMNDVYFDTIKALGGVSDETLQAQSASVLFGKSFQDLIPLIKTSSADIYKLSQRANALNLVRSPDEIASLAALDDKFAEIKLRVESAGQELALKFLPVMDKLASIFENKVFPAIEKVTDAVVKMVDKFSGMTDAQQNFTLFSIGVVAAAGPVIKIIGVLQSVLGGLILKSAGVTAAFTGIFKGSGAAFATAASMGTGLTGAIGKIVMMIPQLAIVAATIAEMAYIINSGVFNLKDIGNLPADIKKMNEGKSFWDRTPLGIVGAQSAKANEKYKYGPDLVNPNIASRDKAMAEYVPTNIPNQSKVDPMAFIRQSLAVSPAAAAQNIADLKRQKDWDESIKAYTSDTQKATSAADTFRDSIVSMVNAIKEQTKSFANFVGLFDVFERKSVSGERLLTRLKAQIKAMGEWRTTLATLEKRGVKGEMLNDLRGMGPGAVDSLKGLAGLSDSKLKEYIGLYGQKNGIAGGEASKLVSGATQIQTKIDKQINIYATGAKGDAEAIANTIVKRLRVAGYTI